MEKIDVRIPFYEAVILANGSFPTSELPLLLLRRSPMVVCCDGAAHHLIEQGIMPHAIVGDGDSLSAEEQMRYAHLLHLDSDQETNDLTKAIRFLRAKGHNDFVILGATGAREDHTLGNISLLVEYMRLGIRASIYTDNGVFVSCHNTSHFNCVPQQQVSIFSFGAQHLTAKGLRYPIYDFTSWWQGTLNECLADSFTIAAEGDYLVYLAYRR